MTFDTLLELPPFSLSAEEKEAMLVPELNALTEHHYNRSEGYRRIADAAWGGMPRAKRLSDVPYLPVSLFKELELSSASNETLVLQSSGATGQRPSRISVDSETADRQSKALVGTFR